MYRLLKWLLCYRELGTFEEVHGRNMRVPAIKKMFQQDGFSIEEAHACGEVLGSKRLDALASTILLAVLYGRFLMCIGREVIDSTTSHISEFGEDQSAP